MYMQEGFMYMQPLRLPLVGPPYAFLFPFASISQNVLAHVGLAGRAGMSIALKARNRVLCKFVFHLCPEPWLLYDSINHEVTQSHYRQ